MRQFISRLMILAIFVFLSACQAPNLNQLKAKSASLFKVGEKESSGNVIKKVNDTANKSMSLTEILDGSLAAGQLGFDFKSSMRSALDKDPVIISNRLNVEAKLAAVGFTEAQKEFQVSGAIYGGIEDVTDETKGLALILNASRLVYDGGMVDAQIAADSFLAESARQELKATLDDRALRLGKIWIELEKYQTLQKLINSRLDVLDPLINQLEQVAAAGIGDVSKVAAAQRIVSVIRVAQTNISEGLAQASLNYVNAFGALPGKIEYDHKFVSELVPAKVDEAMIQSAPIIAAQYAAYQAGVSKITAIRAKDQFNVGFEARTSRPYAGSGTDSDESIGLVARKTLFNGGMLESELKEAEATLESGAAEIKAAYREGSRAVKTGQQSILSMEKAIVIARKNSELTSNEISYLRKQLVIGGSTLESVLSAESRLYDAESKEINFLANKRMSELTIVATLGLLAPALGLDGLSE